MKLFAGIIGMGIGEKHLEEIENYKNFIVKIICEKDKKKIIRLKKKYPSKTIVDDENKIFFDKQVKLVSIASFDNFHHEQIIKGLNNNKNLIIEKPICMNESQLVKIFNLLKRKKKLKITSNLVLRVNSLFNKFKKKIDINKLYYIEADYLWGRKSKLFGWRSNIKDYSVIYGAAIHMIDLVIWLTGLKPINVYTYGSDKVTKKSKFKKKSFTICLFEFPKNILVKITANTSAVYEHIHELKIFSKEHTLVHNKSGSHIYSNGNFKNIRSNYPDKKNRKKLIQNFIDYLLKKNDKPLISHRELFDLMSVCFAAEKSMHLKKKVKINYL